MVSAVSLVQSGLQAQTASPGYSGLQENADQRVIQAHRDHQVP